MSDELPRPGRSSLESWDGQAELPILAITPEIHPMVTEAQQLLDAIPSPAEILTRALVDEAQVAADLARVRELAATCDRLAGSGTAWQKKYGEQIEWKAAPAEPRDDGEAQQIRRWRSMATDLLDMREDSGLKPRYLSYDEARRMARQLLG